MYNIYADSMCVFPLASMNSLCIHLFSAVPIAAYALSLCSENARIYAK